MNKLVLPQYPWLNVASSYLTWCTEDTENWSKAIGFMLGEVGYKTKAPWCAALVHHCGKHSLFDFTLGKTAWPLPATAGCAILGEAGATLKIMYEQPQAGDVFLLYHAGPTLNRFAHTGFVVSVNPDGSYKTIEGNTNLDGSRDGYGVFFRTRRPAAHGRDRFLRVSEAI